MLVTWPGWRGAGAAGWRMTGGGPDPRLLRANDELRRVLEKIEDPSAHLLPRHVYQALERRAQRWSRVVEALITEASPDDPRRHRRRTGSDAA